MPVTAKICGLSTPETIDAALAGGASHIGLVFFAKSPRNVSPAEAGRLAARARDRAKIVGLFVDPEADAVDRVCAAVRLDVIQLHGHEPPQFVAHLRSTTGLETWKAVAVRAVADLVAARDYYGAADRILYDAKPPEGTMLPGGNGLRFDWALLDGFRHPLPWALSGGLDAANVGEAIARTRATLVDVSSGVERAPGVKDVDKIAAFLKAVGRS